MSSILIVDDDTEVLEINKKFLTREGFSVYTTASPVQCSALVKKIKPDCILLDVMMPQMDGFQLCREIRSFSSCPIIFLTGRSSENDMVSGLENGADDYIIKPYSLRELKARIDVLIRRNNALQKKVLNDSQLVFHDLVIDRLAHKAYYKSEDLQLTNREYELLLYLANHPNQDVTYEELGKILFGSYQPEDRRIVMVNISRLRKKFSSYYEIESIIETVWSKGYRFVAK